MEGKVFHLKGASKKAKSTTLIVKIMGGKSQEQTKCLSFPRIHNAKLREQAMPIHLEMFYAQGKHKFPHMFDAYAIVCELHYNPTGLSLAPLGNECKHHLAPICWIKR